METLNNLTFNFNLREPHSKKATQLYLVVKVEKKQIKMPIGVKILPFLWNKRKQQIEVSTQLNEEEREKILQLNSVIFNVKTQCNELFNYLCRQDNINDVESIIKDTIKVNDMANYKAIAPKRTVTATKLLYKAFEIFYVDQKESTRKVCKNQLEHYIRYCKVKGDSLRRLTTEGINDYYESMIKTANEGTKKLSSKTINDRCEIIVRLINNVISVRAEFRKYNIEQVRYNKIKDRRTRDEIKVRALTTNEIKAIEEVKGLTPLEEEVRDLFLVEINSGVRVSDLFKLFEGDYVEEVKNDKVIYTIKTQKRGITASIFINDTISTIINRYKDGFNEIIKKNVRTFKRQRYNETIKSVTKKAGLTSIIEYSEDVAGRKIAKKAQLCDIITSHWARHTFITIKIIEGYKPDDIKYMTGHTDTKMIERIYTHLTESNKAQKVVDAIERIERKQPTTTTSDDATTNALIAQQAKYNFELQQENQKQSQIISARQLEEDKKFLIDFLYNDYELKVEEENEEAIEQKVKFTFDLMDKSNNYQLLYSSIFGDAPTIEQYMKWQNQGVKSLLDAYYKGLLKPID
jgi:integrase